MSGDTVRRAAVHGQVEWLKRLFSSGANPCETDDVGLTPLHYAALNGTGSVRSASSPSIPSSETNCLFVHRPHNRNHLLQHQ